MGYRKPNSSLGGNSLIIETDILYLRLQISPSGGPARI